MKKITTTFFCSLTLVTFTLFSCSKSNSSPANSNPIVGLWIGTATYPPSSVSLYYSYDLRADSTLLFQGLGGDGNTYYGAGKWSLSGSSFTATYSGTNLSNDGVVINVTAVYNSTTGTLIGSQVVSTNAGAIGQFSLNRID
jgi:hypothetical protein